MNVNECITSRRSIRKYKPDPVDHSLIESIVSMASYSPSWKKLCAEETSDKLPYCLFSY